MKILHKQRKTLGQYITNRKALKQKRHAKILNFKNAVSIGIIFKLEDVQQIKFLKNVFKEWQHRSKKIYALGYVDSPKSNHLVNELKHINVITRQHFNFFYVPKGDICNEFIETPFDILINTDLTGCNEIHHVCNLSKAHFKVGVFSSKSNPYDLMLNLNKNLNLRYFIEQVENYLAMF